MQVSISTRHGRLSEATQEKLRGKAEKLARFFDRLMSIEVVVDLMDDQQPKVDVNVSAEHKHDFVAHEQGENLLGVMEACVQKIEQQLRKYKERVQERHRHPETRHPEAGRADEPAPVAADGEADEELDAAS